MPELSTDGGETFVAFDIDEMTTDQAIAVEDAAGLTWLEFAKGLSSGSAKAMRALAWLLQRDTIPDLAIDDVEFRMTDFTIRAGDVATDPLEVSEPSAGNTESSSTSSTESDPGNGNA